MQTKQDGAIQSKEREDPDKMEEEKKQTFHNVCGPIFENRIESSRTIKLEKLF